MRSFVNFLVLLSVCSTQLLTSAHAATILVPSQYSTIQLGINAATNGDTVLVAPGVYLGKFSLSGKAIVLTSSGSKEETILKSSSSTGAVLTCSTGEDTSTVIDDFTLDGSSGSRGVLCSSTSPIIQNCVIHNCGGYTDGGGIYCINSSAIIRRNVIYNNTATGTGSGICVQGSSSRGVEIHHNEIYNALGTGEAIGCLNASPLNIHHNLLRNNTVNHWAASGVYMNGGTNLRVINNTIVGNTHGIVTFGSPQPMVRNNIIANSTAEALPAGLTQSDYNDVWNNGSNNLPGPNGISADPLFTNMAGGNYTLQLSSPCVNAGDPDPQYFDQDGTRNDIGAYAVLPAASLPFAADIHVTPANLDGTIASLMPQIGWIYQDSAPDPQAMYWIQVGDDDDWATIERWDSGPVSSPDSVVPFGGAPLVDGRAYRLRVRVSNTLHWGEWNQVTFVTRATPVIHVPSQYPTIQQAINAAVHGDTILVAPGIYGESINLKGKSIVLASESGSSSTTIKKASAGSVIFCNSGEDTTTVIDGFTIDGMGSSRGILCSSSSPKVLNCEIRNCGGVTDGAGAYCFASSAIFRNNVLHDNAAGGTGSGICVEASSNPGVEIGYNEIYNSMGTGEAIGCLYVDHVNIHHNLLRDNTVDHWAASGIYLNSGIGQRIVNNTIVGNRHGIVTFGTPEPFLRNNIIANNILEAMPTGLLQSDYNDVWNNGSNNLPGPSGISLDPLFADPTGGLYFVLAASPCINAGDPDPQYNDSDGSRSDIGALGGVSHEPYVLQFQIVGEDRNHVNSLEPQFSWQFSTMEAETQDSIEFQVGLDNDWSVAEMWATGVQAQSDLMLAYQGEPLARGMTCYYRLRIHDGNDWSYWSNGSFHLNFPPSTPIHYTQSNVIFSTLSPLLTFYNSTDPENDARSYLVTIYSDSLQQVLVDSTNATTSISGGRSVCVLTNPLADNGHYFWHVRAYDGYAYSEWTTLAGFWVNAGNEAPSAPILESPLTSTGLPAFSLLPLMSWADASDPDPFDSLTYKFELSIKSNFAIVYTRDFIATSSFVLDDSLTLDTHYWWRVSARDKAGLMTTSEIGDFWTWKLGDVNNSRGVDLTDLSLLIGYLTQTPRPQIQPTMVGDLTGDCRIDLSDLAVMVAYMTIGNVQFRIGCE